MQFMCKRRRVEGAGAPALGAPSELVKLSVGGRRFVTTRSTLETQPDSFLARMFASGLQPAQLDSEGYFFIDRDGALFQYVLGFLRDRDRVNLPASHEQLKALLLEANYYGLRELEELLRREMSPISKHYLYELFVWGIYTTCQYGKCNCGLPTFQRAEEESDFTAMVGNGDPRPRFPPPAPAAFEDRPDLVLEFHLNPQDHHEATWQVPYSLAQKIRRHFSPHSEAQDLRLGFFFRGLDEDVKKKELIVPCFKFYRGPGWPEEHEAQHYDMYLRLLLQRSAPHSPWHEPAAEPAAE